MLTETCSIFANFKDGVRCDFTFAYTRVTIFVDVWRRAVADATCQQSINQTKKQYD